MNKLAEELISQCTLRLNENTHKIKTCLELFTEEEVWRKPNENVNSIGNLILHLCGNITQYIISSIAEIPDERDRDLEFSIPGGYNKKELINQLETTVSRALKIISSLDQNSLLQEKSVQGFESTSLGNIIHVTEHYAYHTGQIVLQTKLLKNKDLGFYAHLDLNAKNKL